MKNKLTSEQIAQLVNGMEVSIGANKLVKTDERQVAALQDKIAALKVALNAECGLNLRLLDKCDGKDAEIAALRKDAEAWRHASNGWADSATSGLQWLRNIRDGISTVEAAIVNTEISIKHCTEVAAIAQVAQPKKIRTRK